MTVEQKCRNSSLNKDGKEGKDRKIKVFESKKEKMERKFMKKGSREKDHLIVPNEKST